MPEIQGILKQRGDRYGVFKNHAAISQEIKGAIFRNLRAGHDLAPDQTEALEMIAHKIARIINGDPHYEDSWRDIAGYATLVADRLIEDEEKERAVAGLRRELMKVGPM